MRALVRCFDAWLSDITRVVDFGDDPDCVLRIQFTRARCKLVLADCQVECGEPVLQIHLKSEKLPAIPANGPNLAWAKKTQRLFLRSLKSVAEYMIENPTSDPVRAVGGVTILLDIAGHGGGVRLVERLGFTVMPYFTAWGRFGEFWENMYSYVLIWAFNPKSLSYRQITKLKRREFWISIGEFMHRFGEG